MLQNQQSNYKSIPNERAELRQKQKQMQLQEQQFRLSMSSMKNQISEVIKEDLNESVRSNTGRNTPMDESFRKNGNTEAKTAHGTAE